MTQAPSASTAIRAIESLMLEKFRAEPFHNLRMMYGEPVAAAVPGGTCSDKTLSFVRAARQRGFDVALHSAFIDGDEKHRLARVQVEGRTFFADVGDGWPALHLYPADRAVTFRCFGIGFRTEVSGSSVSVFCERHGRETIQLRLDVAGKPEQEILRDIERRFTSGISYPFSNSLRFALVLGERFLFLRGDRLEIYGADCYEEVTGLKTTEIPRVLRDTFGHDITHALAQADRDASSR